MSEACIGYVYVCVWIGRCCSVCRHANRVCLNTSLESRFPSVSVTSLVALVIFSPDKQFVVMTMGGTALNVYFLVGCRFTWKKHVYAAYAQDHFWKIRWASIAYI